MMRVQLSSRHALFTRPPFSIQHRVPDCRVLQYNTVLKMSTPSPSEVSITAGNNAKELNDFLMNTEEQRLASFSDWPFDEDCNCVPSKMAAAGFYHSPTPQEPDLVRCFMCCKELDGWEPSDDPMEEHRSHAPKCAFINIKKDKDMTIAEFLKLESARQQNRVKGGVESRKKEFSYEAQRTREQIEQLTR